MAEAKEKVFAVRAKEGAQTAFALDGETVAMRLVRAKRVPQVEAHIAQDYTIEVATPDDLHAAGKNGIEIENAAE